MCQNPPIYLLIFHFTISSLYGTHSRSQEDNLISCPFPVSRIKSSILRGGHVVSSFSSQWDSLWCGLRMESVVYIVLSLHEIMRELGQNPSNKHTNLRGEEWETWDSHWTLKNWTAAWSCHKGPLICSWEIPFMRPGSHSPEGMVLFVVLCSPDSTFYHSPLELEIDVPSRDCRTLATCLLRPGRVGNICSLNNPKFLKFRQMVSLAM